MMVSKKQWADIHNAFDPIDPVPVDKLDQWYVGRPQKPFARLLSYLGPDKSPARLLLVGHTGSGKSTELLKLASELERQHNYFVVYIPMDSNIDIEKANPMDILYVMGRSLYKAAEDNCKVPPAKEKLDSLRDDMETIVRNHTENKAFGIDLEASVRNTVCIAFGGAVAAVAGPSAGVVAGLAMRAFNPIRLFSSGISVEVARKREVEPRIAEMVGHLNDLIHDFESKNACCLTLIVDALDKPTDPEVVSLNFAQKRFLADVNCRVVYAAPIVIYYSPEYASTRGLFSRLIELPNVRVRLRHNRNQPDPDGYQSMKDLVYKRLRNLALEPEGVIAEAPLTTLVDASGGVVRLMVWLIREAADTADMNHSDAIDERIAMEAAATLRRTFQAGLLPRHREILKKVRDEQRRTNESDCDMLLRGNFILSYLNDDIWFDVHSILRDEDLE